MLLKSLFFQLFFLLTFCVTLAQEMNYSPYYLQKVKCKKCEVEINRRQDTLFHVYTYKMSRGSFISHGYSVDYYNNGKPEEVIQFTKDIEHGKYISFYENGIVRKEGYLKKTLKHGIWNYYDSTGKIIETIQYKHGNDIKADTKFYYYFTYGLPMFWEEIYDVCQDSVDIKYQIIYKAIAGCCVNNYILKLARKNNRKTEAKMALLHGVDWEDKRTKEIQECCSKKRSDK